MILDMPGVSFLILQKVNFGTNILILLVLENPSLYLIYIVNEIYEKQCHLTGTAQQSLG